jgi:NADH:ubiquinone oxidoreductase subunit E
MTATLINPPCEVKYNKQFSKLDQFIDNLKIDPKDPRRKETLIMTMHHAQEIFGYLPDFVQVHIANRYSVPHADVSGVISFYNFFTTEPKGEIQINICLGTACYVNGADKILQEFEQALGIRAGQVTEDGRFSIDSLRCVGACGLAPVVLINQKVYGKVKPGDAREILEKYIIDAESKEKEAAHV